MHQLRIIVNQSYHSIVSCKLGANKLSSMHEVQNNVKSTFSLLSTESGNSLQLTKLHKVI